MSIYHGFIENYFAGLSDPHARDTDVNIPSLQGLESEVKLTLLRFYVALGMTHNEINHPAKVDAMQETSNHDDRNTCKIGRAHV